MVGKIKKDVIEAIKKRAEEASGAITKIAFFGQPGAGKSALLNAIIGRDVAEVDVRTDTTRESASHEWNSVVLCDLPGYGTSEFPASSYIKRFNLLEYDIILCISAGKFTADDVNMYKILRDANKRAMFIRTKSDTIYQRSKTLDQLKENIIEDLYSKTLSEEDVYFVNIRDFEGLRELLDAMARLLETQKREAFVRSAKSYSLDFLDQKRIACRKFARNLAIVTAATNVVPIPGFSITVSVAAVTTMFSAIRRNFGLEDDAMEHLSQEVPTLGPLVQSIVAVTSGTGAAAALQAMAGSLAVQEVSKYIPFAGSAVSGFVGFGTIRVISGKYIDNCYNVAKEVLQLELGSAG